jgi:hypothetical protein
VGFEPTIPVFEGAKTFDALGCAVMAYILKYKVKGKLKLSL